MVDMSYLSAGEIYWNDWRFQPWTEGTMSGLYRRADFIKAGLLGEVGRYKADDYIIWTYEEADFERALAQAKPQPGLMLQRFLFVRPSGSVLFKTRSFMLGFRGYAEAIFYTPKTEQPKHYRDLMQLVDVAHHYYYSHNA